MTPTTMPFQILASSGPARRGRIHTAHGVIETPAFMPVGTVGAVKAVDPTDLRDAGADVMLSNTYHLLLRPGPEMVARRGGLHRFNGWSGPILTDSGGFQVMSLSEFRKITDEGVRFRSHLDGSEIFLSPEEALRVQGLLGSDIQMILDICPAAASSPEETRRATALSHAWAERAIAYPKPDGILRFGIVQGGMEAEPRAASASFIGGLPFDGCAIGGLSVGEPEETMMAMIEASVPHLPPEKPRYLMGVGKPSQIARAVARGVDLFDCVLPTRVARHGTLWTTEGLIRINREEFAEDDRPLEEACTCLACRRHSRAFLRHLYRIGEPLYLRLASLHNLTHVLGVMQQIRESIESGNFNESGYNP